MGRSFFGGCLFGFLLLLFCIYFFGREAICCKEVFVWDGSFSEHPQAAGWSSGTPSSILTAFGMLAAWRSAGYSTKQSQQDAGQAGTRCTPIFGDITDTAAF